MRISWRNGGIEILKGARKASKSRRLYLVGESAAATRKYWRRYSEANDPGYFWYGHQIRGRRGENASQSCCGSAIRRAILSRMGKPCVTLRVYV